MDRMDNAIIRVFYNSGEKILEPCNKLFINTQKYHHKISHYTDLHGFYGIITDKGFWLTDSLLLNDRKEIKHGMEILKNVITELKINKYDESIENYLTLLDIATDVHEPSSPSFYICCFSEDSDSLDMWRTYKKGDIGLSLLFDSNEKSVPGLFIAAPDRMLFKVIYDDAIKKNMMSQIIKLVINEILIDVQNGINVNTSDYLKDIVMETFIQISWYFPLMKHSSFASEKEIRMRTSYPDKGFKKLNFRVSSWGLVSYYNTKDHVFNKEKNNELLPLKQITVGPTLYFKEVKQSIQLFLKENGYQDIEIIPSQVPFRN